MAKEEKAAKIGNAMLVMPKECRTLCPC